MNQKFLFFAIVAFFLMSTLSVTLEVQSVEADWSEDTHTLVVQDQYLTIQSAIDSAVDGDTVFVKAGTYYEHIVINKTISLLGEDVTTTTIDGNETGHVIDVFSDNVNVTGFTVQKAGSTISPDLDAGISLSNTRGCRILDNDILDNGCFGIHLFNSEQCTISGNNLTRNALFAIVLSASSNNYVSSNIVSFNPQVGIGMHASSNNNTIFENTITNNTWGISTNIVQNSTISNNDLADNSEIGVWMQAGAVNNTISANKITGGRYGIKIEEQANNNTVSGNNVLGGRSGIKILNTRYTEIYNNTIAHNYGGEWDAGIYLDSAGFSKIHSNLITDNQRGIILYIASPNVTIFGNTVNDNGFGVGMVGRDSNYLNVSYNVVMNNRYYGIGLSGFGGTSTNATIAGNLIMNNSNGITLGQHSDYNEIVQNNISRNKCGFYIELSSQNLIYGNNIIDNDLQVNITSASASAWDNGREGNFWNNYNGTDANMDGIGDTPYVIDANNKDNYPLINVIPEFPFFLILLLFFTATLLAAVVCARASSQLLAMPDRS